jgi:sulfatase maturation enzyme AslB (radical SAM superfamily)
VRPIPKEFVGLRRLQIVVSIDGLQPEHDVRRTPATYDRILKHIEGHQITVHCTVTRQQVRRDGYIEEFINFWQNNPHTRLIWVSLYTPQVGELSTERLTADDRRRVIEEVRRLRTRYSKLQMRDGMLNVYAQPPASPDDCIFAQTTQCFSSDLQHKITPCQFGGNPDCANCGCIASAGLEAIGRHRLKGGIPVGKIFYASLKVGKAVQKLREATIQPHPAPVQPTT